MAEKPSLEPVRDLPGRQRILSAAIAQFAHDGYGSASLRKIAASAQVDPALINHQFGSKERLWRACVDDVASKIMSRLERSSATLALAAEHLVDLTCEEPLAAHFVLAEISRQDERFDYVYERLVRPSLAVLRAAPGAVSGHGQWRDEVRLFAIASIIATTIASRRFMVRALDPHIDADAFRAELKAVLAPLTRLGD